MKRRKRKKYVYTASMRPLSFTHEFLNSEQKWISLLQSSQRVPDRFRKHSLFGIGRDVSETWWKALGRELVAEKYLMEATGHNKFSTLCKLTPKVLTPKISHEALSKACFRGASHEGEKGWDCTFSREKREEMLIGQSFQHFIGGSMNSALDLLSGCIQIYKTASYDGGIYVKILIGGFLGAKYTYSIC